MSRILIIGNTPLPFEDNIAIQPAAGFRTWQFLKPLLEAEHEVKVVGIYDKEHYGKIQNSKFKIQNYGIKGEKVEKKSSRLKKELQQIHDQFQPDCVIGVNTLPSFYACQLKTDRPIWADLNGWIMAEAASQAEVAQTNSYLPHYWHLEKTILKRADQFSVVSEHQKWSLYGELASLGKLNQKTAAFEFVHHIQNAQDYTLKTGGNKKNVTSIRGTSSSAPLIKGRLEKELLSSLPREDGRIEFSSPLAKGGLRGICAPDDFVVLFCGGYNTWVDTNTLLQGLTLCIKKNPKVKFVSTGGTIPGLDENTFKKFNLQATSYKLPTSFIFLGWIDYQLIPQLYRAADLGINIDKPNIETWTGARNRLNEMMKYGLPVLTSLGSEISYDIFNHQLGLTFSQKNPRDFADKILWAAEHPTELKQFAHKALLYAKKYYSPEYTTKALQNWVKNPTHAPDFGQKISLEKIGWQSGLKLALKSLKQRGLKGTWQKIKKNWRRI
ncbi:hypothetical protein AUJ78_00510 [Candidatus Peregrinibacteria bacterium CG1_02_41_10]|nr:MAG: hypothetical protein AUJ78_00510 [Candidatus Peregrinibacteria bacterium CG1_02_41_10]